MKKLVKQAKTANSAVMQVPNRLMEAEKLPQLANMSITLPTKEPD